MFNFCNLMIKIITVCFYIQQWLSLRYMQFVYDIFQRLLITKTSVGALAKLSMYNHGTLIQTGTTCKKIYCYMRDSKC